MSDGTPLPNRSAETPVSGRNYPEDDPEGRRWSEIWRAAVEELNANALVSDLGANRVDYEPEDGTLYVPTDGGDWYLGTGTGWSNLGPVGDITDHTTDTTNPHSVTSDQVGSPSDTEFTSHTGDTTNPHSVTATQADALPTSGGTVTGDTTFGNTTHDSANTDEANNTVYASENIGALQSISEGVGTLTENTKQELIIVGGVNEITSTITVPPFGSGVDSPQAVSIKTAGDTVIKQANGAELTQIVDIDGPVAHIDVSIDGNKANNTTAVEGVRCRDVNSHGEVVARVFACDTGVNVEGNTESAKIDVYSEQCGVGVEEQQNAGGDTPDENEITIRGHANDGPFYRKVDAGILSYVHLNVEMSGATGEPNVELSDGTTTLSGISRGGDNSNIKIDGSATVICNGLTASVSGTNDNILQQSSGNVVVTNCVLNQAARHNINATSSISAFNNVITNAAEYGIRLTGDNNRLGNNIYSGNTTGDFLNDGAGDYSRIDTSTFGAGGNVIFDATGSYRLSVGGSEEYRFDSTEFFLNNNRLRNPANTTTTDGMTANPETDTEDGFIEVNIAGTVYQVPIYQA